MATKTRESQLNLEIGNYHLSPNVRSTQTHLDECIATDTELVRTSQVVLETNIGTNTQKVRCSQVVVEYVTPNVVGTVSNYAFIG